MYVVALENAVKGKFGITCRSLEKNPHWIVDNGYIYDSRATVKKRFKILKEFKNETGARKFASVIEAAFVSAGDTKDEVKS